MRHLTRFLLLTVIIVSLALLIATFVTTPDKLGPFGITLWFGGLLVVVGGIFTLLLYTVNRRLRRRVSPSLMADALRQGMLTATWLVGMLALNSLRQLALKDVVLVTLLVLVINFYLKRLRPTQAI